MTESKTAKKPGRAEFGRVLRLIEEGAAEGILSWHADRLARNSIDGGQIIYLLDTGILLDLKFPSFWFENTPQGKFMLSIAFGQSKYYVDITSRRTLSEAIDRSYDVGSGQTKHHLAISMTQQPKTIIMDKKRAPYVARAFKQYASDGYTYVDIRNFFTRNNIRNKSGKILHLDKVKRILNDPFYYSVVRFNGELHEGKHKPLITK